MRSALFVALLLALTASCKDDPKPQGSAPPPTSTAPASSAPAVNVCASGGRALDDAQLSAIFPKTIGAYCIDPGGDLKTYGEKGKLRIKDLCETALDGGCEEYRQFGVTRAALFHYVQGTGAGNVEVLVSQFPEDAAYAIYTTRLVGDLSPEDPAMPKPMTDLAPGAQGAMGTGKAYVWRGPFFLELTYGNDQETPAELAKSSAVALAAIAKEVTAKLPEKPDVPASAKALPEQDRMPLGVLYFLKDAGGITGTGAGALGYYKKGDVTVRELVIAKTDLDQAKDVMHAVSKLPGALPVASLGDDAAYVVLKGQAEQPKTDWVFSRKGSTVFGVADSSGDKDHKAALVLRMQGLLK